MNSIRSHQRSELQYRRVREPHQQRTQHGIAQTTYLRQESVVQMECDQVELSPLAPPEEAEVPTVFRLKCITELGGRTGELVAQEVKQILVDSCNCDLVEDEANRDHKAQHQAPYEDTIYEVYQSVLVKPSDFNLATATSRGHSICAASVLARQLQQDWCAESGFGLEEQARLTILGPTSSFWPACKPAHDYVSCQGIAFGNMINYGVFCEAWQFHFDGQTEPPPVAATFEHDRKQLSIYVVAERGIEDERESAYEVRLRYAGIHHVVVDLSAIDHKGCVSVYFELKFPPQIRKGLKQQQRGNAQQQQHQSMRHRSHFCEYRFQERVLNLRDCPNDVIGDACTLKLCLPITVNKLQFGEHRVSDITLWEIVSRLKRRVPCDIWYAAIKTTPREAPRINFANYSVTHFPSCYALEALLSRGYRVKDQMSDYFLRFVVSRCSQNPEACEKALNHIVNAIDEHKLISLLPAFDCLYQSCVMDTDDAFRLDDTEEPENCCKVRKVVITPTRRLFLAPEVQMHNRITRKFKAEFALRVSFRDDSMDKFFGSMNGSEDTIFHSMVGPALTDGVRIGNRRYEFLGWSNSQLRDHGCYMYCQTDEGATAETIRIWMGDFSKIKNIPKLMARMGQCFTQSQKSWESLHRIPRTNPVVVRRYYCMYFLFKEAYTVKNQVEAAELMRTDPDVTGGAKDKGSSTGERFCFSDGVGRISKGMAEKITSRLRPQPSETPSAFQIRYGGFKGMLSLDPRLDNARYKQKIIFRESMHKFDSTESKNLEVVKWSQPTQVTLNRPLIMILDQMTKATSLAMNRSLRQRVHGLLEEQLFGMAEILMSEEHSAAALTDRTPLGVNFRALKEEKFIFTSEPFFRSLLLAIHAHSIQSLFKCKIEIPWTDGRVMYGVMDEFGILNYGQVFVQYSVDPKEPGSPSRPNSVKILTGPIMVTKNPCIVPGDVRKLTAVDCSSLRHLVDVIVFPRNGPRPHTDEMAGSDLDGDEYAVFWDDKLFLPRNYQPMYFSKTKPKDHLSALTITDMIEFFRLYVKGDNIGQVATAHLVLADQLGIEDQICQQVAEKHSQAVDFPKTGIAAPALTEEERPRKYPDFMGKEYKQNYRSKWLLGELHRKIKKVQDIINLGQCSAPRVIDPDLYVEGWEKFKDEAIKLRDQYNSHLQHMLDQYGVNSEAQLVSGHMLYIRNRLSDREKEDFSFFNTERIVELRIRKLWIKFRDVFYSTWGQRADDFERDEDAFVPFEEMRQKAVAWYLVTYDAQHGNQRFFLSFPWIVWRVLRHVKRDKVFASREQVFGSGDDIRLDPITENLYREIKQRTLDQDGALIALQYTKQWQQGSDAASQSEVIKAAVQTNHFLQHLIMVLLKWAAEEDVLGHELTQLQPVQLCLLLLDFLVVHADRNRRLTSLEQVVQPESAFVEYLFEFLKYLASERFRDQGQVEVLTFVSDPRYHVDVRSLSRLHQVAFKTFNHVALTGRFESLHVTERPPTQAWDFDETDPIEVEGDVFSQFGFNYLIPLMKEWSDCSDVDIRKSPMGRSYFVSASGRLESRQRLRAILLTEPRALYYAFANRESPMQSYEF